MAEYSVFTSESVSEGHPDKVADQISDAILDAMLEQDAESRVACETMIKTGVVIVAGEIRTNASINIDTLVRQVIAEIGYDSDEVGFNPQSCTVINALGLQSTDIAMGVDESNEHEQGAGDQGLMFGYATNETDVLMPAPITYAHRLVQKQAAARRANLSFLRPDAKSQLSFHYDENGNPMGIDAVVLSTQHSPDISQSELHEAVMEEIVKPVLPANWMNSDTKVFINPTGQFIIGGPVGDCGLTGRKIIVDTYGGYARHGGGAFSGKDPTKVDRSAAYAARYVAKCLVAAGLAERAEVQLSYAIGVAKPVSILVESFGTSSLANDALTELVQKHFDLRPGAIIETFDLRNLPQKRGGRFYQNTAAYGHFGRNDLKAPWEDVDAKAAELRNA